MLLRSIIVTPRMRRVSRNLFQLSLLEQIPVTPRMRRVSRNASVSGTVHAFDGHASHEACE